MSLTFSRDILRTVVAQICQTIGWHAIHATPLELMVDFLHRNLEEICKVTHRYTEQFGQTLPNLDHLGLAFQDLGIVIQELEDYIRNVDCVPCAQEVPQYPLVRDTHLNFLKPGSHEVVRRPVHVHEHLPPMHPDLEEQNKQVPLLMETPASTPSDVSNSKASVFKRPGDPLESPAIKRARLLMEEEGRPLREISSVMMTTSGFISPAREGKLPESRAPLIPSDSGTRSPVPSSFPTVPPEVKSEKKMKKSPPKKAPLGLKKLDKENSKKKEPRESPAPRLFVQPDDDPRVKKLASMKELNKWKAIKGGARKVSPLPPEACHGNPKDYTSYIQNLSKASKQTKSKPDKHNWPVPGPSTKTNAPFEKSKEGRMVVEGKLSTEPDKQKLNILKKISKVKEDKVSKSYREDLFNESHGKSLGLMPEDLSVHGQSEARLAQIDECINAVLQQNQPSTSYEKVATVSAAAGSSAGTAYDYDDYQSETYSPPGTPSTPRTPELPMKLEKIGEKKHKKEKVKSKSKSKAPKDEVADKEDGEEKEGEEEDQSIPVKKAKIETIDLEPMDRPKTPEPRLMEPLAPIFPFYPHFPPAPGLIPPPIMHPFFPTLQLPFPARHLAPASSLPHPAMPNLPLPPPCFMQNRNVEPPTLPEVSVIAVNPEPSTSAENEKPCEKIEKKSKEHKKDKKEDKKPKKKKEKKEKNKNKEKSEKKKEEKKEKDKEKSKEKKEKKEKRKEREREEKSESGVPKITLKLGPSSPRPPTPDAQTKKISFKPVVKKEEPPHVVETPRAPSPELARFSALITRPPKQKSKAVIVTQEPVSLTSSASRPKTPELNLTHAVPQALPSTSALKSETKIKETTKKSVFTSSAVSKETVAFYHDDAGNKIWICPACKGPDDGSPMIGCDDCDAWYHWVCVGIQVPPDDKEDWYCRECIQRKEELFTADKKKKSRKKKI